MHGKCCRFARYYLKGEDMVHNGLLLPYALHISNQYILHVAQRMQAAHSYIMDF
jgi:hypothetical protein